MKDAAGGEAVRYRRYYQYGKPVGLMLRRENLANAAAREFLGTLYSVLSLHVDRRQLKKAADWHGVLESLSIEFRRYADGEAGWLLRGEGRHGRPIRPVDGEQ